jgi:hypothetical protein
MAFFPIPFGHVEVRVDTRPQLPPRRPELPPRPPVWGPR